MGCCGKNSGKKYEIYVIIEGQEYYVGPRPLYMFLRSLAPQYQPNVEYDFKQVNKKTGGEISGKLSFSKGIPYIDGRRLM